MFCKIVFLSRTELSTKGQAPCGSTVRWKPAFAEQCSSSAAGYSPWALNAVHSFVLLFSSLPAKSDFLLSIHPVANILWSSQLWIFTVLFCPFLLSCPMTSLIISFKFLPLKFCPSMHPSVSDNKWQWETELKVIPGMPVERSKEEGLCLKPNLRFSRWFAQLKTASPREIPDFSLCRFLCHICEGLCFWKWSWKESCLQAFIFLV